MNKLVKALVLLLCVVALVGGSVAGTLAWLVDKDDTTNTFTAGNINIELTSATASPDKNIVPGATYDWTPQVTVEAGSEACYLFVKFGAYVGTTSTVADGETQQVNTPLAYSKYLTFNVLESESEWTRLEDGVYYRLVDATDVDKVFSILNATNSITATDTATKKDYDDLGGNQLVLSITAYAVQQTGMDNAADAWNTAKALDNQTPTTP